MKNFMLWWMRLRNHAYESGYTWVLRYFSFVAFCFNVGTTLGTFVRQHGIWNAGLFNLVIAAVLFYFSYSTYKDVHLHLK